MTVRRYGEWPSPVSAQRLASGGVGLGEVRTCGDHLYWLEARPAEGGRQVVMSVDDTGKVVEVSAAGHNVRTLVHEYGGGAYLPLAGGIVYANFADQRLWWQDRAGGEPRAITPAPPSPRSVRYADMAADPADPDPGWVVAVRETHSDEGEAVNEVVRIELDTAAVDVVASGADFYSSPRPAPGGSAVAYLCWNHPDMPWDSTELRVADPAGDQVVAGGPGESVQQPAWTGDGRLRFVSDRSGWWNLYETDGGSDRRTVPDEAEYGVPGWVFGQQTHLELPGGRVVAVRSSAGSSDLVVVSDGRATAVDTDLTTFGRLAPTADGRVATVTWSVTRPAAVTLVDVSTGAVEVMAESRPEVLDERWVSVPESITFPTTGGEHAHALWYAPCHPDVTGPDDELPPLVVMSHGGPTSQSDPAYDERVQFWTTRGIGVVDVNYRGSTGYGRAYRNRLRGGWGVVDTDDCIAAAQHLAGAGLVDPERMAIRGGSAGGYTTLCALTFHDVFTAGCSLYGVADVESLARDTHKFESRYLDRLIGPYPEQADLYRARSPIHFTDRLSAPMILLQGLEDEIVPPSQAEQMVEALRARRIPFAYLPFEGEQHGFRKAESIRRAAEAELAFYGEIFGFEPADDLEPLVIER